MPSEYKDSSPRGAACLAFSPHPTPDTNTTTPPSTYSQVYLCRLATGVEAIIRNYNNSTHSPEKYHRRNKVISLDRLF